MKPSSLMLFAALVAPTAGCETANELLFEPPITDPNDGLEGNLAQAGMSTEMDWGEGQGTLLSEYQKLNQSYARLQKQSEELRAQNQNLLSQLTSVQAELEDEKGLRTQAESQLAMKSQDVRQREAKILTLSIEKAKLEQERLQHKINALNDSMTNIPTPTEATATPPRTP
jgi:hypothetical protein